MESGIKRGAKRKPKGSQRHPKGVKKGAKMGAKTTQGSERGTLADKDTKSIENCGFLGCVLDQVLVTIHQETIKIAIGNSSTIQTRKNLKINA
jgi:hypothetical protein